MNRTSSVADPAADLLTGALAAGVVDIPARGRFLPRAGGS